MSSVFILSCIAVVVCVNTLSTYFIQFVFVYSIAFDQPILKQILRVGVYLCVSSCMCVCVRERERFTKKRANIYFIKNRILLITVNLVKLFVSNLKSNNVGKHDCSDRQTNGRNTGK